MYKAHRILRRITNYDMHERKIRIGTLNDSFLSNLRSSIVNDGIRGVLYLLRKDPTRTKSTNAHKRIKTKTVLNAHKKHLKEESRLFSIKKHEIPISD